MEDFPELENTQDKENRPKEIRLGEAFYPFDVDVEVFQNVTHYYSRELKEFKGRRELILDLDDKTIKRLIIVYALADLWDPVSFAPFNPLESYRATEEDFDFEKRRRKLLELRKSNPQVSPNLSNPLSLGVTCAAPTEEKEKRATAVIKNLCCQINFENLGQRYAGFFWGLAKPHNCNYFFPLDTGPLAHTEDLTIVPADKIGPGQAIYLPSDLDQLNAIAFTIDFAPEAWVKKRQSK